MAFAVVGCQCGNTWSVDLRNRTSTCTSCRYTVDLRKRRRLWEGTDGLEASSAAAAFRTARTSGHGEKETLLAMQALEPPARVARHDDFLDAAAAKAQGIINKSARAEAVLLWLTRLSGPTNDDDCMAALRRAGLTYDRAEKEIIRMLAGDIIYEPKVGFYAVLDE